MTATEVKAALATALGANGGAYWQTLSDYLYGKLARVEFDHLVRQCIDTPALGQYFGHCSVALRDIPFSIHKHQH